MPRTIVLTVTVQDTDDEKEMVDLLEDAVFVGPLAIYEWTLRDANPEEAAEWLEEFPDEYQS